MNGLAAQFSSALVEDEAQPVTDAGLVVKILHHRHADCPGHDAAGVIPLVVVGHRSMDEKVWRRWVRENGVPHYGAAFTEKMIEYGVSIREMLPTAGFGRQIRDYRNGVRDYDENFSHLDRAEQILTVAEKWPSVYNAISEWAGKEMTLEEFCGRVMQLPPPLELARGAYTTLGDLVSSGGSAFPSF